MPRKCKANPEMFCYIWGKFTILRQRKPITPKIKECYKEYFGMALGDQDKWWCPHSVCGTCYQGLLQWKSKEFIATLKEDEKNSWLALIDVVKHFLGNNKSPNYARIVEHLISKFHKLECITNLKFHFMDSHLNPTTRSEIQGERFHQDFKIIEQRYNGLWNQHMVADYCWNLMHDDKKNIIDFTEKNLQIHQYNFLLLLKYYCIFMNNVY
ncbi:hypothetical protein LAZ67_22000681 [Cordylochernes scorpioides]|uniref:Uncharacterized protein n=1 Tax=Cordylochernes scorpioides TaxID=51811 RepID=A0ABY6LNH4_9ARAC|nr:hypothetical protein LAZ67_22000681 [Cordylochernes scorpioides]